MVDSFLVTGANGLVGSSLVRALRTQYPSAKILALVRQAPSQKISGVDYVQADLTQPLPENLIAPGTTLFHFAHLHKASDLETLRRTNVQGLERLLKAGGSNIKKVFLGSSMSVYGQGPYQGVQESDPKNPQTALALTRLEAERLVENFTCPHLIFRPRFLFDPREKETLPKLYTQFRKGVMLGSGEQRFSFIVVDDYVSLILHCLTQDLQGALNVAYPKSVSLREIYQCFGEFKLKIPVSIKLLLPLTRLLGAKALSTKLELVGQNQILDTTKLQKLYPDISKIDSHQKLRDLAQQLTKAQA